VKIGVGEGAAIYHTAGALGNGERVWMLAKLPDDIQVADGDISNKYLLLSNSHDGRSSVQVKFTPVRVVCNNTLVQALGSGETIRVSHTSDLKNRLDIARQNLLLINTRYTAIESTFRDMLRVKMDDTRLAAYLKLVFPEPHDPKDERAAEHVWKIRKSATFLFVNGKGNRLRAVAGTLWAAYNGVAEMIDHGPTSRKPAQQSEIHLVRQRRRN
jgi:phage/plasmid-like protein (TIGR03299 family)